MGSVRAGFKVLVRNSAGKLTSVVDTNTVWEPGFAWALQGTKAQRTVKPDNQGFHFYLNEADARLYAQELIDTGLTAEVHCVAVPDWADVLQCPAHPTSCASSVLKLLARKQESSC